MAKGPVNPPEETPAAKTSAAEDSGSAQRRKGGREVTGDQKVTAKSVAPALPCAP
jgi:hypothetical protein